MSDFPTPSQNPVGLREWVRAFGRLRRARTLRRARGFGALLVFTGLLSLVSPVLGAEVYNLTNRWILRTDFLSDTSPAVAPDGTVYVGTFDGQLWAVTPAGQKKWTFQTGREVRSSPAVGADGTVYFGSRDRHLYAVSPEGQRKWAFKTGAWVDSSPAVGQDGTVYAGSWDGKFYAVKPGGVKQWEFDTRKPIVSSAAVGFDGTIYFGSHDRKFYALAKDGSKRWEFATAGAIVSSPALDGEETIYFTSTDGFLYALTLEGALRWKLRTGGVTEASPALGPNGTVYLGVNTNFLAVSPAGKVQWQQPDQMNIENTPLVFRDGSVCYVSRHGTVVGRDPTGLFIWRYYLYGHDYSSPAVSESGVIYLPTHEGAPGLCALTGGGLLAQTPWPKFRGNARNTGNVADRSM